MRFSQDTMSLLRNHRHIIRTFRHKFDYTTVVTNTPEDPIDLLDGEDLFRAVSTARGLEPLVSRYDMIQVAWELWTLLTEDGWCLELCQHSPDPKSCWMNALRSVKDKPSSFIPTSFGARNTAAVVICRCFLKINRLCKEAHKTRNLSE
jgi:hypothetical protein